MTCLRFDPFSIWVEKSIRVHVNFESYNAARATHDWETDMEDFSLSDIAWVSKLQLIRP